MKASDLVFERLCDGLIAIDEADYHAHSAISRSQFLKLSRSYGQFADALANPHPPTKDMKFGSFFHHLSMYGEDATRSAYLVSPGSTVSTMSQECWDQANRMVDALFKHPTARRLIEEAIASEVTGFAKVLGRAVRIRADWKGAEATLDLKSCADASVEAIRKSSEKYGYDIQAYLYPAVRAVCLDEPLLPFVLLNVSKELSPKVTVFEADRNLKFIGQCKVLRAFMNLQKAQETGGSTALQPDGKAEMLGPSTWELQKERAWIKSIA
jgi:hypothetical protein